VIVGLGIDVCPVERMAGLLARFGERGEARLFTAEERRECADRPDRAERLAGRFAAKEAAIKALGGPPGLRWHDLAVVRGGRGEPHLVMGGEAAAASAARGATRAWVSLSHAGGVAVAVVVLESEDQP